MEELKKELKEIYYTDGESALINQIGNVLDYEVFVKLGNSFLPEEERYEDHVPVPYATKFIIRNLIKEFKSDKFIK